MEALDYARTHLAEIVAETEAMLAKHRDRLATVDAAVAAEAAKVPTWEDVRAMIARVPSA